ncbi:MAG: SMP-30/gluconolactonase/LRE family protein [Terriglobales bacterium]
MRDPANPKRAATIRVPTEKSAQRRLDSLALSGLIVLALLCSSLAFGSDKDKKKKDDAPAPRKSILDMIDKSKVVWPQPPNIARVKYMDYFAGEKLPDFSAQTAKPKSSWMDRLAGTSPDKGDNPMKNHFFMGEPHGLAMDSKGKLYVADGKVGAIFIIDPETKDTEMMKNGKDASFALINGLAIDDSDRLFVSDSQAHRVLVFDKNHKGEAAITQGLDTPAGMAIDNENRFLYVADIGLDQVLVYDADNLTPIRRIGTADTKHESHALGDFSKPTSVALDQDGNVYVTDMLNYRVEVFDADGKFIRTFGKHGDGPGYFAMPKGIAVDCDGHIWVTDSMQNRVHLFTQEGDLLMWMGSKQGVLPGTFSGLQYIMIDKQNRVFTSETYPGRVQEFRYVTQDEAQKELARREAEKKSNPNGVAKPAQKAIPAPFPNKETDAPKTK